MAIGFTSLPANTSGTLNVAVGARTLTVNTTGTGNRAVGDQALSGNTIGFSNTATGNLALTANTSGNNNTAIGFNALSFNRTGYENTACGSNTLINNTTGFENTAVGFQTLISVTTGASNLAVGYLAGSSYTTENNNICILNTGGVGDNAFIRIGEASLNTNCFIAGIAPVFLFGAPVVIDLSTGQLGAGLSSMRYKEDIKDMNEESSPILNLRPVTFRYKGDGKPQIKQYGLIAEEVNNVMPNLVLRGADGQIEAVQYTEITSLLLNEVIKQHRIIEDMKVRLAALEARA